MNSLQLEFMALSSRPQHGPMFREYCETLIRLSLTEQNVSATYTVRYMGTCLQARISELSNVMLLYVFDCSIQIILSRQMLIFKTMIM